MGINLLAWMQFAIQWLHVILGVFWLGGVLFLNIILLPALGSFPFKLQREILSKLGAVAGRAFMVASVLIVLLGILRGTLFGPIKSLEVLATPYGITFIVSLLATLATIYWGHFVVRPIASKLFDGLPNDLDAGKMPSSFEEKMKRVKILASLEFVGFFVIFTCMILMRFGL